MEGEAGRACVCEKLLTRVYDENLPFFDLRTEGEGEGKGGEGGRGGREGVRADRDVPIC